MKKRKLRERIAELEAELEVVLDHEDELHRRDSAHQARATVYVDSLRRIGTELGLPHEQEATPRRVEELALSLGRRAAATAASQKEAMASMWRDLDEMRRLRDVLLRDRDNLATALLIARSQRP